MRFHFTISLYAWLHLVLICSPARVPQDVVVMSLCLSKTGRWQLDSGSFDSGELPIGGMLASARQIGIFEGSLSGAISTDASTWFLSSVRY